MQTIVWWGSHLGDGTGEYLTGELRAATGELFLRGRGPRAQLLRGRGRRGPGEYGQQVGEYGQQVA